MSGLFTLRKSFFIPIISWICLLFLLPQNLQAQEETSTESLPDTELNELDEMPFYISCGPNYNKFSGSAYPVKFDFKFFIEGGVLLQYVFLQTYPFYAGIEYQRRGYDYNINKKEIGRAHV